ncbi:MAG TPA: VOC family protein [Acetobacteraceae bacterium]|nr:VOC family protein [Acetobacteraceae bacterium]
MQMQPYLFFDGRCEEAIAFYQKALGAKQIMMIRFKDAPDQSMVPPGGADRVMHARLDIGGNTLLLSDGSGQGQANFQGFALCITAADPAEAERRFNALADGGQVRMPLDKTFFSPAFGMLADRFGVSWMVYVA